MTNTSVQQSLSQWVEEQFALSKMKIAEAQATINQAKEDIAYLKRTAKLLENSAGIEDSRNDAVEHHPDDNSLEPKEARRLPKDMLFPAYADMSRLDAIHACLSQSKEPLSPADLTREIYDVQDEAEFQCAKASLSTELRRGAEMGKWKNVGRGQWQVTGEVFEELGQPVVVTEG